MRSFKDAPALPGFANRSKPGQAVLATYIPKADFRPRPLRLEGWQSMVGRISF